MPRYQPLILCLSLVFLSASVAADSTGLQRCRALTDSASRLACYDALAATAASTPAPGPKPAAPQVSPNSSETFGFETRRLKEAPSSIESHIPGHFKGWNAGDHISLANGQVWKIADGSQGALWFQSPKVLVRRGVFGAYYLDIDGTNRSPRVERIK